MLAARYYGIGDVRVEEVPRPVCAPGEVLIKVAYAGICGSDLHIYRKGMFVTYIPVTMGHEFSGVVAEVGADVTGLSPGDAVVGDPRVSCGNCEWCRQGQGNRCPELGFIGEVSPGCFAGYLLMKPEYLLKIPQSMSLRKAALVEPLAVALHIAAIAKLTPGVSLGIVGAGPIGLLTILAARAAGISRVAVVDLSPGRRAFAEKLGADLVMESFPEDASSQVDVVIEAVGVENTLQGAVKWLKPGGRLIMAGLYEDKILFDPNDIVNKELDVKGVNAYGTGDLKKATDYIDGGIIDVTPVVSHILPLASAADAFTMLTASDKNAAKILFKMDYCKT
ncbi:Sorbitol dehydrogenase [Pelotomaculum sp. FP]|uniref:zinc-dependent alcohol dehydrogenase n=1 Tax=Pelotomaculum sp. FP TaxID=261474 RepID=UPI001065D828|nr:alcohol dehydrogenase catalytic domain-containing protein [Pelotomaculum sp. FP]TEB11886.1 Sorbitol dehydrogenase [Pelotomaculum sp. FP]